MSLWNNSIWNGGGSGWINEVNTFSDLPDATLYTGKVINVLESTGFLWSQRKGLYQSDGSTWKRLSNETLTARDDELAFVDDGDNTKKLTLELDQISPSSTRIIKMTDYDYDLENPIVDSTQYDLTAGVSCSEG